jgi:hypothetical protein
LICLLQGLKAGMTLRSATRMGAASKCQSVRIAGPGSITSGHRALCRDPARAPKRRACRLARGSSSDPGAVGAKPTKHDCFLSRDVRSDL